MKFYLCLHCGNIITYAKNKGVPVVCCGDRMSLMVPNSAEADHQEHIPMVEVEEDLVVVNIGEKDHPMTPAHYIEGIVLETEKGFERRDLEPIKSKSEACFALCPGDYPVAAYAYCNRHKLWKTEIK